ncbi:MAG TPA: hypothetical protein VF773_15940 [Verrucomicrobiae bacterium]
MNPTKYFVVQKGHKYLTPSGGWSPRLSVALIAATREEAVRNQQRLRARGTVNLVEPVACEKCTLVFDPIMGHTCTRAGDLEYVIRRNFNSTYLSPNSGWCKSPDKARRMTFTEAKEIQERLDSEPNSRGAGIDSTHTVCLLDDE